VGEFLGPIPGILKLDDGCGIQVNSLVLPFRASSLYDKWASI